MTKNFKEWFVAERANALAMIVLTRRDDLVVRETKQDTGLDYAVLIKKDDEPGQRMFGVMMRATMSPVGIDQANAQLKPSMGSVKGLGPFNYPVGIFYFTVKDDQGYFTWVYEPFITELGQPKLMEHKTPNCVPLNDQTLDAVVASVNAWYDALLFSLQK